MDAGSDPLPAATLALARDDGRSPVRRDRCAALCRSGPESAAGAGDPGIAPGTRAVRQPAPGQASSVVAPRIALERELLEGVDCVVVRELTGGIYFGRRSGRTTTPPTNAVTPSRKSSASRASPDGSRARDGCEVTSVDKANVLETSRLWRQVVTRVMTAEFPDVRLEHQLVDSTAMLLLTRAGGFRRDRHRESIRRHPERRGRGTCGFAWTDAVGVAR